MFNEDETFSYSIDVAKRIYQNLNTQEDANKLFYKQIELFFKRNGQKFIRSQGNGIIGFDVVNYLSEEQNISVLIDNTKKSVSGIILPTYFLYTKQLFEEGLSNKCLFGLPIYTMQWADFADRAIIYFMTLDSYLELKTHSKMNIHEELAEEGDANSQFELGLKYYYGTDVVQDYTKSAFWTKKAAEQGHAKAQYNLALCYEQGYGVKQDYICAYKWYHKAAEQGIIEAMIELGLFYYLGRGTHKNYNEAVKWWGKAAALENSKATFNLACCYRDGTGVTQDFSKAKVLFSKASQLGDPNASKALTQMIINRR